MTARDRRHTLAAIGTALLARDGGPGERRAAALRRRLAGGPATALSFEDLPAVPSWARLPHAARRQIAHRAALASIAPTLAVTIDGAVLRDHAAVAGEEALDWAIAQADRLPADAGLPAVDAAGLDARGLALMRATLPENMRCLVDPGAEPIDPPRALAEACVAAAIEGAATS
ncbi:hypothetical protein HL653_21075 [Sphingomonas sp. AP4-R1]|uniref:hypothetical protein n=1 Tax=Sphingomonas sp. AP4-R1 TaxID=2735134 RepID=UPI00149398F5|nr:hypothetical protein [Sphingomonas sp. AP4-R1]QJU59903.1 hypothetical protein HL653_21075 [Sphingomonas sp. AP4-R1]